MTKVLNLLLACIIMFGLAQAATPESSVGNDVEYYPAPPGPGGAQLPFSKAVRVGNLLFLSGELGVDYSTQQLVPGGISAESKQVMENIKSTLETYGSSLNKVIKCTIMIADMKEWGDFNKIYATYFDKNYLPARAAFGANGLAFGARVEVDCIAVIQ